jgi:predicted ribosome quality control (RQC) complex YloA/Tae2 family protein
MRYTLGQAAQATGKSKMTIQRVIKKGVISANKTDSGEWEIDPAELHRVFPLVTESDTSERIMLRDDTHSDTSLLQREIVQDEKIRQIEQQGERERHQLQNTIDDLRRRLDQSEEERRRTQTQLTALLTDQRQKVEAPPPPPSFWQRLLKG